MNDFNQLSAVIPVSFKGERLDCALSYVFPDYSRTRLQKWIRNGNVLVNGKTLLRPRDIVSGGENVLLEVELVDENQMMPEAIDLDIVYEDQFILVINKPAGLVVHPGAGNPSGTLANALLHHDSCLSSVPRAGIVHRLDRDTSGLMVVAKQLQSHSRLVEQLRQRVMRRKYIALVYGNVKFGGTVDAPVGRHPVDRKRMAVVSSGKQAITHYRVRERFESCTLLDIQLDTGRTHQIRVHMAHMKYPIVGDPVYGKKLGGSRRSNVETLARFPRQALHASSLEFMHPNEEEKCEWFASLPQDFQQLLDSQVLLSHETS